MMFHHFLWPLRQSLEDLLLHAARFPYPTNFLTMSLETPYISWGKPWFTLDFPFNQSSEFSFGTKVPRILDQKTTDLSKTDPFWNGLGRAYSPRSYGRTFRDSRPGPTLWGACGLVSGNPWNPWCGTMESNQESSICEMSPEDFPCWMV